MNKQNLKLFKNLIIIKKITIKIKINIQTIMKINCKMFKKYTLIHLKSQENKHQLIIFCLKLHLYRNLKKSFIFKFNLTATKIY